MKHASGGVRVIALVLLVTFEASAASFSVPPLRSAVTDLAGILSPTTARKLEFALVHLTRSGDTQLAVLTVPDLGDLSIEQASIRVVDEWKLGSASEDKGVLLLVAPNERKVRIEVGQGLEGVLTDAHSKRIIDEGITPLFRDGDMNGGVTVGVYQIAQRTNPEVDLKPYLEGLRRSPRARTAREASWPEILFFVVLLVIILSARSGFFPILTAGGIGGLGGRRGGSMMGGHRGRAGGFGSFSGGGGGFSGGGASGGW